MPARRIGRSDHWNPLGSDVLPGGKRPATTYRLGEWNLERGSHLVHEPLGRRALKRRGLYSAFDDFGHHEHTHYGNEQRQSKRIGYDDGGSVPRRAHTAHYVGSLRPRPYVSAGCFTLSL